MKRSHVLPLLVAIVVADFITKFVAVERLTLYGPAIEVFGEYVRWYLIYNPGAAFGLYLGPYSRWIFTALTFGALIILWRLYKQTVSGQTARLLAITMVASGAIGNLIDRLRSNLGVVDFIDVGIGTHRWPTFNIADMAVSCGAVLLAIVLWREESEAANEARTSKLVGSEPLVVPEAAERS